MLSWEALEEACQSCNKCALCETRKSVVFGVGRRDAEVMLIGEGPGEQEDLQGEPFVGTDGKLLDDMLAVIGLDRSKIYIANVVKCRPPNNRDPLNLEQSACVGYLRNQVALIRPRILVALGRIAAQRIIDENFKITADHGKWHEKNGFWLMGIYHPSFLLRDVTKRPAAFEDLKRLEHKIIEICERTTLD